MNSEFAEIYRDLLPATNFDLHALSNQQIHFLFSFGDTINILRSSLFIVTDVAEFDVMCTIQ